MSDHRPVDDEGQPPGTRPTRRGRPRDEARRAAILEAAGALMLEGGLSAATVEAIAARAGVSKQTIYNWWPSRGAVAFEGFLVSADPLGELPPQATAAEALGVLVGQIVTLLSSTPAGPLMRGLIADGQSQPEVAELLRDGWLGPRRVAVVELLEAGIASGELRADLDVETAIDLAFAPVYYRLLLGHGPIDEAFGRAIVDHLLRGIRA